jgi:hypothetical protein
MLLFQESGSAQDIVFVKIKLKPEHEDVDLDDLLYNTCQHIYLFSVVIKQAICSVHKKNKRC